MLESLQRLSPSGLMLLSVFFYSSGEAILKSLSTELPSLEIVFIRSLFSFVILGFIAWQKGLSFGFQGKDGKILCLRSILAALGLVLTVSALKHLQIASFASVFYMSPLVATLLSLLFLKEKADGKTSMALGLGLIGVVCIANPSTELFSFSGLLAFLGMGIYSITLIMGRFIKHMDPVTLYANYVLWCFLACAVCLIDDFVWPTEKELLGLSLLAFTHYVGYMALTVAMAKAPIHHIAPYQYTSFLWAIGYGWVLFDDVPSTMILMGAGFIMSAAILPTLREKIRCLKPNASRVK